MTEGMERYTREALRAEVCREVTGSRLLVECPWALREDFQIHMLRSNTLPHILAPEMEGVGSRTRLVYPISGMTSLHSRCERRRLSGKDLRVFLRHFLRAVEALKEHMLFPDGLWLEPARIFVGDRKFHFCYLPAAQESLAAQFHLLTEYFVREIDYQDRQAILLAQRLHRQTLEENFDLREILGAQGKELRAEKKCRQQSGDKSFRSFEASFGPERQRRSRRRASQGRWEDLLLESDGQEELGGL